MGLIRWLSSKIRRSTSGLANPQQWLLDWFAGGAKSRSGIAISEEKALTYTAYYACVDLIARSVAQLPCIVYRRNRDGGRERAIDHPNYPLLHDQANDEMTAYTFFQTTQGWCCTWGNGYAEIARNGRGRPSALYPLPPHRMTMRRDTAGRLWYDQKDVSGNVIASLPYTDVLHPRGIGDGLIGWSPVRQFREALGLGLAAERYGSTFFGNDASPGGVLQHPGKLGTDGAKTLKASWESAHAGDNTHKVAVLEEGMTWQTVGMPNDDAQFLESRKFQIAEMARIFHIPPHMIGDLDRATFSNIEHQAIEYVTYCLDPWLRMWEQELNWKLFTEAERKTYYCEFLVDSLLRGDTKSRYEAYNAAIVGGWINRNEVRQRENLNPEDGLDEFLVPVNMTTAEKLAEPTPEPAAAKPEPAPSDDDRAAAHREALKDICRRIVTKASKASARAAKGRNFRKDMADFYKAHAAFMREALGPAACAAAASLGGGDAQMALEVFVNRHCDRAQKELWGAYKDGIPALLANWEKSLPEVMATELLKELQHAPA